MKLWISLSAILIAISSIEAKSISKSDNDQNEALELWQPEGVSREDYFRCKGMPCEQYKRKTEKLDSLQDKIKHENDVAHAIENVEGCASLTEENVDEMKQEFEKDTKSRVKRKLAVEKPQWNQYLRWEMPINYKFDGTHSAQEKGVIKKAVAEWETRTCVRFVERKINEKVDKHHLIISRQDSGCYSYVGKNFKSQLVNLGTRCLFEIGTAIHELGHSLGLWHEHQRNDRDKWVKVNRNNIYYYASQFNKIHDTMSHGVPYDFSSVMHYTATAGGFGGKLVLESLDPLYQSSMGQRFELSYLDAKIINLAYCSDKCENKLSKPCARGGYQDPNNCKQCICPDGFTGEFCEQIINSKTDCGGTIEISSNGQSKFITSPGYENGKHYNDYDECTWLIKSPANSKVVLTFEEDFGMYSKNLQTCYHFVEVKYGAEFDYPGPRFCGYDTPTTVLKSKTNEMLIMMKANHETLAFLKSQRRGFKARVHSESTDSGDVSSYSTTTTTKSSTTSPTSTTTSPTSTTTSPTSTTTISSTRAPTTTAKKVSLKWSEWSACSHECGCGSCSKKTRHTICGKQRCTGSDSKVETRLCSRECTVGDKRLFPGSQDFYLPCPRCCKPYKREDGKCV